MSPSPVDRAGFEAIATMCGIGLGTTCYCRAYHDGVARGEPGVPGVGEDVLGVKPVVSRGKQPRQEWKLAGIEGEQLALNLGEIGVK